MAPLNDVALSRGIYLVRSLCFAPSALADISGLQRFELVDKLIQFRTVKCSGEAMRFWYLQNTPLPVFVQGDDASI